MDSRSTSHGELSGYLACISRHRGSLRDQRGPCSTRGAKLTVHQVRDGIFDVNCKDLPVGLAALYISDPHHRVLFNR